MRQCECLAPRSVHSDGLKAALTARGLQPSVSRSPRVKRTPAYLLKSIFSSCSIGTGRTPPSDTPPPPFPPSLKTGLIEGLFVAIGDVERLSGDDVVAGRIALASAPLHPGEQSSKAAGRRRLHADGVYARPKPGRSLYLAGVGVGFVFCVDARVVCKRLVGPPLITFRLSHAPNRKGKT